jgi:hypothetical protein
LCLFRYRELARHRFVDAVEDQLRDAVRRGHDVQTHLHPHWLTAECKEDTWSFDPESFLLGTLGDADHVYSETKELLIRARQYLESLLKPMSPDYRTVAYRAGGYGLQPNERAVLKALEDTGYLIESSVVPGMRLKTGRHRVDFTSVPARSNWIIGSEGALERESASGLLEVPIPGGTVDLLPFLSQTGAYVNRRVGPKQQLLGGYGHSHDAERGRAAQVGSIGESWSRKIRTLRSRWSRLSIPAAAIPAVKNLTENWVRRHARDGAIAFSMLLHSKGLTQSTLDDVRIYTQWLQSRYRGQVGFVTFSELARRRTEPGRRLWHGPDVDSWGNEPPAVTRAGRATKPEAQRFFRKGVIGDWQGHFDQRMLDDLENLRTNGLGIGDTLKYKLVFDYRVRLKNYLLGRTGVASSFLDRWW